MDIGAFEKGWLQFQYSLGCIEDLRNKKDPQSFAPARQFIQTAKLNTIKQLIVFLDHASQWVQRLVSINPWNQCFGVGFEKNSGWNCCTGVMTLAWYWRDHFVIYNTGSIYEQDIGRCDQACEKLECQLQMYHFLTILLLWILSQHVTSRNGWMGAYPNIVKTTALPKEALVMMFDWWHCNKCKLLDQYTMAQQRGTMGFVSPQRGTTGFVSPFYPLELEFCSLQCIQCHQPWVSTGDADHLPCTSSPKPICHTVTEWQGCRLMLKSLWLNHLADDTKNE